MYACTHTDLALILVNHSPQDVGTIHMMSLWTKNEFLILVLNSVMMIFMQELYTLDVSGHQPQALHYVPEINGFSSYAARLIFCMFTCYISCYVCRLHS